QRAQGALRQRAPLRRPHLPGAHARGGRGDPAGTGLAPGDVRELRAGRPAARGAGAAPGHRALKRRTDPQATRARSPGSRFKEEAVKLRSKYVLAFLAAVALGGCTTPTEP